MELEPQPDINLNLVGQAWVLGIQIFRDLTNQPHYIFNRSGSNLTAAGGDVDSLVLAGKRVEEEGRIFIIYGLGVEVHLPT